jgi:hypothetical protein
LPQILCPSPIVPRIKSEKGLNRWSLLLPRTSLLQIKGQADRHKWEPTYSSAPSQSA